MQEKSFNAGPLTLNYAEGPAAGPPLVLLHGITQRWQSFLPIIPFLTESWRVYAVDFRGHGKSGRAQPGEYRGEDYSADIIAFLEKCVGEPAILVGHSLGGMVTLYLASHRQELVRAAVLGDSILRFQDLRATLYPSLFNQVVTYLGCGWSAQELANRIGNTEIESPQFGRLRMGALPGTDDAYLRAWAVSLQQLDPETLRMTLNGRAAKTWDGREFVKSVRCPTMLLQADPRYGALMSDEDVQCVRAAIPGAVHVRLEGIGHALHMYQAAPVVRAILNFLATLE